MYNIRVFIWELGLNKYLAALLLLVLVPAPSLARDDIPLQLAQALQSNSINRQLNNAEILVATFTPETTIKGVSMWAAIKIPAPLEDVFAAINLCEQALKWHKKLKACRRTEQGPDFTDFEQRLKFSWYLPEWKYKFRASYPHPDEIRFQAISGDIKTLQGGWQLYPRGEATLAVYFITIQPRSRVPKWLMKKAMRADIPEMLRTINKIATKKVAID